MDSLLSSRAAQFHPSDYESRGGQKRRRTKRVQTRRKRRAVCKTRRSRKNIL